MGYVGKGECGGRFDCGVGEEEYRYFMKKEKEVKRCLGEGEKEYKGNKKVFDKKVI